MSKCAVTSGLRELITDDAVAVLIPPAMLETLCDIADAAVAAWHGAITPGFDMKEAIARIDNPPDSEGA